MCSIEQTKEHSQPVGLHRLGFPKNAMMTLAPIEFLSNLKYSLMRFNAQYGSKTF